MQVLIADAVLTLTQNPLYLLSSAKFFNFTVTWGYQCSWIVFMQLACQPLETPHLLRKKPSTSNCTMPTAGLWTVCCLLRKSVFFFSCVLLIWRSCVSQFHSEDCVWQSLTATEYFNAFILAEPFIQKGSASLKLIKLNSSLCLHSYIVQRWIFLKKLWVLRYIQAHNTICIT